MPENRAGATLATVQIPGDKFTTTAPPTSVRARTVSPAADTRRRPCRGTGWTASAWSTSAIETCREPAGERVAGDTAVRFGAAAPVVRTNRSNAALARTPVRGVWFKGGLRILRG